MTPEEKNKAEQLIKEEMHRSRKRKKDYIDQLPPIQKVRFDKFPMLHQELKRVAQKKGMPRLDMTRYNMEPPPTTRQWETSSWQHAVNNARSQLEHQYNRISNLELLIKYGINAWRAQVGQDRVTAELLDRDFSWQKKEVDRINRERKLGQIDGGKELQQLEQEWNTQVQKSSQMLVALQQLQWEIEDLRSQCDARGIRWQEQEKKSELPPLPGEEEQIEEQQEEQRQKETEEDTSNSQASSDTQKL